MTIKVLVVDDAPFMRATIGKAITENGWVVAGEAGNGKEAIERFQEVHPDVVTLDITMPDMDGLTALKAIKQIDATARIIMCSAVGQKDNVIEAHRAGAKTFLVKPFKGPDVIAAIEKAMAQ